MRKLQKDKKGFSTVTAIVTGILSIGFLAIFASLFFSYMTDDTITGSATLIDNVTTEFTGNFSSGVTNVSNNIPTIFSIGVFVLIISVLLVAYVFARRNGFLGGGGLG